MMKNQRLWWIAGGFALIGAAQASPASAESASQTFDVVAVIEPELSLSIAPETGTRLDFGTLYSSEAETRLSPPFRVAVHVFSNLGRPYQITQQLLAPLTNEAGAALPPEHLLVVDAGTPQGMSAPSGFSAGQPHVVFSSDLQGHSTDRALTYQLRVPPRQAAGTYRGTILTTVTAQ